MEKIDIAINFIISMYGGVIGGLCVAFAAKDITDIQLIVYSLVIFSLFILVVFVILNYLLKKKTKNE